jgi:molybdenum cofactor guanylyltransferase
MDALSGITAVVLAGGRGLRMGGVDKGLQTLNGMPLVQRTLLRLNLQSGGPLGGTMVNANRNLSTYEALGAPVWSDTADNFSGPLAGFLTGLQHCETPLLLTVPCDTPLFPLNLAERLFAAMRRQDADLAMASAPEPGSQGSVTIRTQPVFCLLNVHLKEDLIAFINQGGRKIDAWTATLNHVVVPFDLPDDDPRAFFNANTLEELLSLQDGTTQ